MGANHFNILIKNKMDPTLEAGLERDGYIQVGGYYESLVPLITELRESFELANLSRAYSSSALKQNKYANVGLDGRPPVLIEIIEESNGPFIVEHVKFKPASNGDFAASHETLFQLNRFLVGWIAKQNGTAPGPMLPTV